MIKVNHVSASLVALVLAYLALTPVITRQAYAVPGMDAMQTGVPPQYQDLYTTLNTKLDDILSDLDSRWKGELYDVDFAGELITANGHRGETLLKPEGMQSVTLILDRLKSLGVRGVKVAAHYPLMMSYFPNHEQYLEFYKKVSQEVKARGLVLYVAIGTLFRDPSFTDLRVDYSGLTFERFKEEKRYYAQLVLENLKPDYLTITNEPQTQEMNTGLDFSVENVRDLVEHVLDGLDRGSTLVGAGAGTWDKIAYFESLAEIQGLDYLDMHIYPVDRDFVVDKAFRAAEMAKSHNKKLLLSESWLYKVRENELGGATATSATLFARDVFSFWAPLDQKFIEMIVKLAHLVKLEFCSFFWIQFFYSYIDYDEEKNAMTPRQLSGLLNAAASENIASNTLSPTGQKYKSLIAPQSSVTQTAATTSAATATTVGGEQVPSVQESLRLIPSVLIGIVLASIIAYVLQRRRKASDPTRIAAARDLTLLPCGRLL